MSAEIPGMAGMAMDHGAHSAGSAAVAIMPGMDRGSHGASAMSGMSGMGGMRMGHGGMGEAEVLASSSPAEGAALPSSPSVLGLAFKRPVRIDALQLFDSTGARVPLAAPIKGTTRRVTMVLPTLPPDAYEARWRASTSLGVITGGSVHFRIG